MSNETKKSAVRLYVVGKPDGSTVVAKAISEQQAKAGVASLDKYTARIAKPADTLGVKPEDVVDATAKVQP